MAERLAEHVINIISNDGACGVCYTFTGPGFFLLQVYCLLCEHCLSKESSCSRQTWHASLAVVASCMEVQSVERQASSLFLEHSKTIEPRTALHCVSVDCASCQMVLAIKIKVIIFTIISVHMHKSCVPQGSSLPELTHIFKNRKA
jgi:hypothetical protein